MDIVALGFGAYAAKTVVGSYGPDFMQILRFVMKTRTPLRERYLKSAAPVR